MNPQQQSLLSTHSDRLVPQQVVGTVPGTPPVHDVLQMRPVLQKQSLLRSQAAPSGFGLQRFFFFAAWASSPNPGASPIAASVATAALAPADRKTPRRDSSTTNRRVNRLKGSAIIVSS
jgi:hypothetical protein